MEMGEQVWAHRAAGAMHEGSNHGGSWRAALRAGSACKTLAAAICGFA